MQLNLWTQQAKKTIENVVMLHYLNLLIKR